MSNNNIHSRRVLFNTSNNFTDILKFQICVAKSDLAYFYKQSIDGIEEAKKESWKIYFKMIPKYLEVVVKFLDVKVVLRVNDVRGMNAFDKRKLVLDQLKWLAVYLGIAFVIAILLPFPIDWLVAIPIFLLINLYRRKIFFRKLNIHFKDKPTTSNLKGIREFFKLVSHNPLSQSDDSYRHVKYFCMKCGKEHNEISCPKCGSKMKRVG